MPAFTSYDGTRLAYHVQGQGAPLICVPGGPMQDSAYLGDLGGLSGHRRLVRLDLRGTGASAPPEDPATYRCDRLAADVEALRVHLGLDRMDLLAHSAGTNIAVHYATRHPARVGRLVLVTPSLAAPGIPVTGEDRLDIARLRENEPWYPEAFAALTGIVSGHPAPDAWDAIAPFSYGRWTTENQTLHKADATQRNQEAAAVFASEGAFTPEATRVALGSHPSPVLLLAGAYDLNSVPSAVAGYAALFPDADCVTQPETGHFPWRDAPARFTTTVATWLRDGTPAA
ncbi:alpha/beta hydrolase [Sphaerisporangium sp. B11E5]|uniref:alpha/beta fold hydrolase n=1 Tax=Sphaerisporangium sp. B11E5 TaxID=3153563 RepID=UPI00325CD42A